LSDDAEGSVFVAHADGLGLDDGPQFVYTEFEWRWALSYGWDMEHQPIHFFGVHARLIRIIPDRGVVEVIGTIGKRLVMSFF
jgi:hypothetical protein